jgi:DNA-binding Lrp family transcriptional regulator
MATKSPYKEKTSLDHTKPNTIMFINIETGHESEVVKELDKIEEVKEYTIVYGAYDIVAKVQADTMDKLKQVITWKIRRINNIRSTLSTICYGPGFCRDEKDGFEYLEPANEKEWKKPGKFKIS